MKKIIGIVLMFSILILHDINAFAGDIEKGTIAVAAATNAHLGQEETSDWLGRRRSLGVSTEIGYFFADNWEIGSGIQIWFYEFEKNDLSDYTIKPYLGYTWALNDESNIYARIGGGYGSGVNGFSSDGSELKRHLSLVFGELGYEFFLTQNIAIDLSLLGQRSWTREKWNDEDEERNTKNSVVTQLKFKLYF